MKLVLLGKPGSGKGSEAGFLVKKLKIPTISTGDMLRSMERKKTKLAKLIRSHIDKGEMVPNGIVLDIIKKRLSRPDCKKGFILDGFPRYIEQAKALEKIVRVDNAVYLDVPDSLIIRRLSSRRSCSNCGAIYNLITNLPKKSGICNKCGGKLYIRKDDKPATIRNRLKLYNKITKPVIDFYRKKGMLVKVDGSGTIEKVGNTIIKALRTSA